MTEQDIAALADGVAKGKLSMAGELCNGILTQINGVAACPDQAKLEIASYVSGILAMFTDAETRVLTAKRTIRELRGTVRDMKERLAVLNDKCFGNGSERGPGGDSACAPGEDTDEGFSGDEPDEDEEHEEEKRAKGKSVRKLPKDIRTIRIEHYPDDMTCCTCGCQMKSIKAEERVGMLRIVPEHVVQVKNVYHTCACNRGQRCKENGPVYTKAKGHIMKGRTLEAGLVVEAACQKFFESTATYRMERRMINNNVHLCRQTLGRNIIWLSECLLPVRNALLDHVKRGSVAHMDETPLRIQPRGSGENATGKSATGYLWAICRDERRWNPEAQPAVCYHYAPTRSGQVAEDLLSGSAIALLLTDGYAGYNRLFSSGSANALMAAVRCWAHARRKFHETIKATDSKLAKWVRARIDRLYRIESMIAGQPAAAREAVRQMQSLPLLVEIRAELLKHEARAHGELKKAITYTLNAFDALQRFAFDGRVEIDNNPVERCMRLIALAKKNSIGAGSHEAAQAWATYYTLIESARLNRINPRAYLNWVVGEIERTQGEIDHATLMPWHCPVGRLED